MNSPLDNPALFKKYDRHRVLDSILALPKQCNQAWEEASRLKLPATYRNPRNIMVAAMGGSALGGHMIKSIFANELKAPFEVVNHYALPASVDRDTLVFLVSYSGATEEVLAAAEDARKRGAKIVGITVGGTLGQWCTKHRVPCYVFEPKHNPSGQPRLGTGYTMTAMLAVLAQLRILNPPLKIRGLRLGEPSGSERGWGSYEVQGNAKQLALKLKDRGILIFASEHLEGNAHTLANQINESAKQFAVSFAIPEMNHHLMEGLTFPQQSPQYLGALFLASHLYHPRAQKRYRISQSVLLKQRMTICTWTPRGNDCFSQALETLSFGSFLAFYLAMLNHLDPSAIKWVNYFKLRLSS